LCLYAAILNLLVQVSNSFESRADALKRFPFLIGYHNELADLGLFGIPYESAAAWWNDSVIAWEKMVTPHLPLRALRMAVGMDPATLALL